MPVCIHIQYFLLWCIYDILIPPDFLEYMHHQLTPHTHDLALFHQILLNRGVVFKGLIMDGCVLLTSTPECVVSPRRVIPRAQPEGSPCGETTHSGVDVNNTHPSMINPNYNMILANLILNYQYFAY